MGILKRLETRPAPGPTRPERVEQLAARMYHAARASRLTSGWGASDTSADAELSTSLRVMRARSRALVRDAAFAKRGKVVVQNNVVGAGIGMQAQVTSTRNELREAVNAAIEQEYYRWSRADSCHTGGTLHFCDFERTVIGQVYEAGEAIVRKHYRKFGSSRVPFAVELIEPERLPDEMPQGAIDPNNQVRMSVEVDRFHRPVAYWIRQRHPGEIRLSAHETDRLERVPAEQIIHLKITERWPQTRGEPWMHPVIRKLNDMDGYSEAEIIAARGSAAYMAFITTQNPDTPLAEPQADQSKQVTIEPGIVEHLAPGEGIEFHSPNRPNAAMEPFMRMMLREVAAGIGVSYESLSRDYSQSNYSSSRLALLDDRDLWKVLQQWFIRSFREPLHREWLQQAVLAGAIPGIPVDEYALNPQKFEAVAFKPRGWSWVDPTKEVDAYKEAVRAGFTTVSDVIAATGGGQDIEDVLAQRRRELDMMADKDLVFDTDPQFNAAAVARPKPPPDKDDDDKKDDDTTRTPRVVSFGR